jgi:hypothetical protein
VLLTTRYLDGLADLNSAIDTGRVIADGTPDRPESMTGDRIDVVLRSLDDLCAAVTGGRRERRPVEGLLAQRRAGGILG